MRIGLDVSPLARAHSPGLSRAVGGLAAALEARGRVQLVRLAPDPGEDLRAWRHARLPRLARELALDGLHSCVSAFPLRAPVPVVQTVHELPWRHGVRENADLRHRAWVHLGALRAARTATACEFVARELRGGWRPSRVRVVPWGVGAPFGDEPPAGTVDEMLLGRLRLGQDPLALCPGATRAKKGLARLLHGLAALAERRGPRFQIVVTGPDTPDLRRDLGLAARLGLNRYVSTPGTLSDSDLAALYRLATAVPVLSRSEGFALPVLEAMASGTPVIVPRDSAQAELAGEAGLAIDADDPAQVALALERAHAQRFELRAPLLARARSFTWERSAESFETLWQELA
jgi:alpha-1,3-rhamnosyl/mannosyltransferase